MTGDKVDNSVASYGLYPLSALDVLFERTTFVTGWLVEGTINHVALANALKAMTEKWRMLAGRLVSQKVGDVRSSHIYTYIWGVLPISLLSPCRKKPNGTCVYLSDLSHRMMNIRRFH